MQSQVKASADNQKRLHPSAATSPLPVQILKCCLLGFFWGIKIVFHACFSHIYTWLLMVTGPKVIGHSLSSSFICRREVRHGGGSITTWAYKAGRRTVYWCYSCWWKDQDKSWSEIGLKPSSHSDEYFKTDKTDCQWKIIQTYSKDFLKNQSWDNLQ